MSDTTQQSDPQATRPRRNWLLIASLAVNLLVIAGIGSAIWKHNHGGHRFRGGESGLMSFVGKLPADRRDALRADLLAERQALRPIRQALRQARMDVSATLAAEPFDRVKAEAASQRLMEVGSQLRTRINQALINAAEKMTAEERRMWKEWRDDRRKKRKWGKGGGDDKDGDREDDVPGN